MLHKVDRHLWVAEQPLKFFGLEVGTRMTAILLSGDRLLLISPIKIEPDTKAELDRLGEVKFAIAPNLFHHLYLEDCKNIYPQAELIAPPGIESKQPNLAIDKIFTRAEIDFNGELAYTLFVGFQVFVPPKIATVNEIVFFHPETKTLIITDSAFNFDRSFPWITQLAARVIGSYNKLKPSQLEKVAIQDRAAVRQSVDKILAWDFTRVILAHGKIVENNAKEQLTAGFEWLIS